jgi:hypothetical protein
VIALEIVPADARIAEPGHDACRIVGAAVADDEQFEVLHGLQQDPT